MLFPFRFFPFARIVTYCCKFAISKEPGPIKNMECVILIPRILLRKRYIIFKTKILKLVGPKIYDVKFFFLRKIPQSNQR